MSERLAEKIRDKRASDRLAALNNWFGVPPPPKAPAEQSQPDCAPLPGDTAGVTYPPKLNGIATSINAASANSTITNSTTTQPIRMELPS